jgi:lipid-A-disaccharide synthase
MPVLEEFTRLMAKKYKNVKFIIPTIESLEKKIREMTCSWSQKPVIVANKSQKVLAYYSSAVAVAVSGTVTVELARVGLPFVAIYKTSYITYLIVKFLIKVNNICLVNLLSKKKVIPELLQKDCTGRNIFNCVEKTLRFEKTEEQKRAFQRITNLLKGEPNRAATEVLKSYGC